MTRGWRGHEHDIAEMFGLDQTLSSGSKFHDPGDAVTRGKGHPFPLYAEAKYTEHMSKTVRLRDLMAGQELAVGTGKRFIMPIRFWPRGAASPADYILLSAHDFAELFAWCTSYPAGFPELGG